MLQPQETVGRVHVHHFPYFWCEKHWLKHNGYYEFETMLYMIPIMISSEIPNWRHTPSYETLTTAFSATAWELMEFQSPADRPSFPIYNKPVSFMPNSVCINRRHWQYFHFCSIFEQQGPTLHSTLGLYKVHYWINWQAFPQYHKQSIFFFCISSRLRVKSRLYVFHYDGWEGDWSKQRCLYYKGTALHV